MARTGVRKRRAVILGVLVGAVILMAGRAAGGPPEAIGRPAPVDRYVVRSGDTLWEIARARVGAAGDPRPFIEDIQRLSGLGTSTLRAGQVLVLPAP